MLLIIFSLVVIGLALLCGFLMLWRIPWAMKAGSDAGSNDMAESALSLSVIIPARNEINRLQPLLDSLAGQSYKSYELIVVDDQSTDGTDKMAAVAGARVLRTEDLSDRWIGKSFACWTGALAAKGKWLFFLDADTKLETADSLERIVESYLMVGASGILSFQPYHQTRHLYESFSALFNIIVMAGMNVFTPWKDKFRSAGSFGPSLICDRDEYFSTGGHEAVSAAIMDDLALGELFMSHNLKVRCYGGRHLISFRMYPEGFRQLFEGWTKNFGTASQSTHPFVFALIIIWISGGYSTTALLIRSLLSGSSVWIITAGAAYITYMLQLFWQARRTGNFSTLLLIFYPLLHIFFTVLFLWSLFLTRVLHIVSWRGRKIKV